ICGYLQVGLNDRTNRRKKNNKYLKMEIALIPNFLIKHFASDYYRQNDYNILISNLAIIIFFVFSGSYLNSILNYIPHFCLIDKITGTECPVCGTTRAFYELSDGNLNNAYNLNRTSIIVAIYFIFQIPLRIISIIGITKTITINKISKYFSRAILTIILINWIIKIFTNQ
ncbi:DUF2752 domain-containing protein, partial [Crocinitomicaceae bacterium]|nr:DUF2752 domain-containing protein [Crocinitomicaceae bacterium]